MSTRPLHRRILRGIARYAPPAMTGTLDLFRPSISRGFGGPFNGQARRVEAVRDIFSRIDFKSVIETGTYRATTTRFLRTLCSAPLTTVEADRRFYQYSRLRLFFTDVKVIRGDSASVLNSLSTDPTSQRSPAFFYLDAHWLDALPLPHEVERIASSWTDFVILIDDFMVPGDPGYAYDDYGAAGALELRILRTSAKHDIVVYWPSAPSSEETGARRGSIVLASAGLVDESLRNVLTLRRAGKLDAVLREPPIGGSGRRAHVEQPDEGCCACSRPAGSVRLPLR